MTMKLNRAFNANMLTKFVVYRVGKGFYDDNNDWIEGSKKKAAMYGVITSGNKFARFDEGVSLKNMDGGKRYSDYKSLAIEDKYDIQMQDIILYKGVYFNVLQQYGENDFGFNKFIIEKRKHGS